MKPQHLSPELIDGYRARSLRPAETASVARHLSDCPDCRSAVLATGDLARLAQALDGSAEHLSYEELESLANGRGQLHPHVANCSVCAAELADLVSFRASLASVPAQKRRPWYLVPAGALAAAAIVALFAATYSRGPQPSPSTNSPAAIASIVDSHGSITLDQTGTLHGLDGMDAESRQLIADVLKTGQLPAAAGASDLIRNREVQLGPATPVAQPLHPLFPVGTALPGQQPVFKWDAPASAHRFIVSVYTADFTPVAGSPALESHEWAIDKPLPPGTTFLWTVSAVVGGARIAAPRAPEPEARFRTASREEQSLIETVQRHQPPSDLLVAVTAAKMSMFEEARQALERLQAKNAGSPLVASLQESLRQHSQPSR